VDLVLDAGAERQVHVIPDNFSAHRTALVNQFLQQHPNVQFHFTPTYSSLLNQVESWLSKLQRDVIDLGIHLESRSRAKTHALHPPLPKRQAINGNTPMSESGFLHG
jgi:hypothetical protein